MSLGYEQNNCKSWSEIYGFDGLNTKEDTLIKDNNEITINLLNAIPSYIEMND